MTPMLARTYGPKYSTFPCFVQPKLNGVRALYQNGVWQSRDEKLWKPGVLKHLTNQLETISSLWGNAILDGELYVHGWKLQRINGAVAVNRLEPIEDTLSVCYYIFDVVDPERNFSSRWFDLYTPLQGQRLAPSILAVPTAMAHSRCDVDLHFASYTKLGYEGIMLRPDGPYELGETAHGTTKRSKFLWKHKEWRDDEFVCVGYERGEGKASIGVGALICTTPNRGTFNVGTGFSDEERIELMNNPPVGRNIKVKFLCLSNSGIPLNPSFLAVM